MLRARRAGRVPQAPFFLYSCIAFLLWRAAPLCFCCDLVCFRVVALLLLVISFLLALHILFLLDVHALAFCCLSLNHFCLVAVVMPVPVLLVFTLCSFGSLYNYSLAPLFFLLPPGRSWEVKGAHLPQEGKSLTRSCYAPQANILAALNSYTAGIVDWKHPWGSSQHDLFFWIISK